MNSETNIFDYFQMFYKRRRMIITLVASVTLATLIRTNLSPKIYQATATLLPPLEQREPSALGLDVSKVSQLSGGLISTPTTTVDIFVAMLKSRTMADALVEKFDLMKVYQTSSREGAQKRLQSDTRITLTKEKVISIAVEATSPQLAADLANYYTEYLDILNRSTNIIAAKRNRLFIEQRLNETKTVLAKIENEMEDFQTKHKTVSLDQQARASLDAAAQLQGKVTTAEVQLQVMESYLSPNNPDVIKQRLELTELERQLRKLQYGSKAVGKEYENEGVAPITDGERLNPALVKMPGLGLDLARLTREVKAAETLFMLLTSQLEQAKITEARDMPTVQVLDKAVPPEHKSKPIVRESVMFALGLSSLLAAFLAFFLEYIGDLRKQKKKG